jgi:hypothetical protein
VDHGGQATPWSQLQVLLRKFELFRAIQDLGFECTPRGRPNALVAGQPGLLHLRPETRAGEIVCGG